MTETRDMKALAVRIAKTRAAPASRQAATSCGWTGAITQRAADSQSPRTGAHCPRQSIDYRRLVAVIAVVIFGLGLIASVLTLRTGQ